jgi:hypothetical protein
MSKIDQTADKAIEKLPQNDQVGMFAFTPREWARE